MYAANEPYYQGDTFANAATGNSYLVLAGHSGTANYVYLASPTFVWNVSAGYVRFVRATLMNQNFDLASLGFPASFVNALPQQEQHFPNVAITDAVLECRRYATFEKCRARRYSACSCGQWDLRVAVRQRT